MPLLLMGWGPVPWGPARTATASPDWCMAAVSLDPRLRPLNYILQLNGGFWFFRDSTAPLRWCIVLEVNIQGLRGGLWSIRDLWYG